MRMLSSVHMPRTGPFALDSPYNASPAVISEYMCLEDPAGLVVADRHDVIQNVQYAIHMYVQGNTTETIWQWRRKMVVTVHKKIERGRLVDG